ncbi:MAG: carboxylating nicotinate-nucleotide diphosphorylase [Chitinophagales bacterium]
MQLNELIRLALAEDLGEGDHSAKACIPENSNQKAFIYAKSDGVLSGIAVACEVFKQVDPVLEIEPVKTDAEPVANGDKVMLIKGSARSILAGERLALNFLQRMSGVAGLTRQFVEAVEGTGVKILDTRKTTPLLRALQKQAVLHGGGENHRFGLYDMIMLKENHIAFAGGISKALDAVKKYQQENNTNLQVEIETRNIDEVREVLKNEVANRIMLDNFTVEEAKKAVQLIDKRMETEISGGINLSTVRSYAETGVDFISVGALTHSAPILDLSLLAED